MHKYSSLKKQCIISYYMLSFLMLLRESWTAKVTESSEHVAKNKKRKKFILQHNVSIDDKFHNIPTYTYALGVVNLGTMLNNKLILEAINNKLLMFYLEDAATVVITCSIHKNICNFCIYFMIILCIWFL